MTETSRHLPTSESLLNAIGQGVIVLASDRTILFWSEWVARAARISAEDAMGRDIFDVFPQAAQGRFALAIRSALERGSATFLSHSLHSNMLPLYRPTDALDADALIAQSTTISGVRCQDDGTWCCIVAITDVGPMLAREAALRRAKEDADAANMAKSRFVANVSHELRTPLNAVLGFSELLVQKVHGALGSEKYDEYIQHIASSGQHLLSLIDDILDLSKVESGQFKLDENHLSLNEIARASAEALYPQAERKQQRLSLHLPDDPVALRADERAVRQILMNLLSNALKFMSKGGHVSLAVRFSEHREPQLVVSDDGPGIPRADIGLVLSPYGQSRDVLTTRTSEGTGLGLPICKALTTLHDGTFHIDSDTGQGTTVTVTFPSWRALD